jgi:hypothetical protein
MNVYGAMVEWYWQEDTQELTEKPVPMSLCPPQIARRLVWGSNTISAVRSHCLTAWYIVEEKGRDDCGITEKEEILPGTRHESGILAHSSHIYKVLGPLTTLYNTLLPLLWWNLSFQRNESYKI